MINNVIPYELKGKEIDRMQINSIEDAEKVKKMFYVETDKWLKKKLALKLLDYKSTNEIDLSINDLLLSIKCRIDI